MRFDDGLGILKDDPNQLDIVVYENFKPKKSRIRPDPNTHVTTFNS